jgi:hypothetical protein
VIECGVTECGVTECGVTECGVTECGVIDSDGEASSAAFLLFVLSFFRRNGG